MIQSEFYPDDYTGLGGAFILSKKINAAEIPALLEDIGRPYYMGYVPYEQFPKHLNLNFPVVTDDEIKFTHIKENHPWGYCSESGNYGTTDYPVGQAFYRDESNTLQYRVSYSDTKARVRFINKISMASVTHTDTVRLNFVVVRVPTAQIENDTCFISGSESLRQQAFTTNELLSFNNGGNLTIDDITFSKNDYNEETHIFKKADGDYTIYASVYKVDILYQTVISSASSFETDCVLPFFRSRVLESDNIPEQNIMILPYGAPSDVRFYTMRNSLVFLPNIGIYSNDAGYGGGLIGCFPESLTVSELAGLQTGYHGIANGKCIIGNAGYTSDYDSYKIYSAAGIADIITHMSLFNKRKTGTNFQTQIAEISNTYTTDYTVSLFNDDNTPKSEIIVANYPTISDLLQQWQIPGELLTDNDFNVDDMPEYEPEPGDDADTLGADITGFDFTLTPLSAANNFTTLYALTTGQLAAFGRTLWAKLWSEDFWKSVGTTFLNDFSINPADMMRYFINLHYFPFDLSVYPWSSTDGVYVGRAVEPIAVETRVFSRNLIQIDGGVCAVPAYYHDFRDYEPCTNVEITIPFCGNVQIAPSECIGKVLSLTYTVDMQTGAITALVYVNSDKKYIVAQLSGQCAATIPITADNNLEFVGRIAKVTGATLFEGIKSGAEMFKESESVKGAIGIGAAVGIASGAAAVTGLPPVSVHKMGESGGFANYGGAYRAYITVTRQKYSVPTNYGGTVGYAADFTAPVGSLSGLFACQNVDTSGLTCNYDERAEIKRLLESGCYM